MWTAHVASHRSEVHQGMLEAMTAVEIRDDEQTAMRSEQVIALLGHAMNDLASQGSLRVVGAHRVFLTAAGWWIGMTRSAQAVVLLRRSGFEHEAAPIVRTILQHGLVLQWLVDTGEQAVDAVDQYGSGNLRKLLKSLSDSNWPLPDGFTVPSLPSPSDALKPLVERIKNFERLCIEYDAGQVYALYRLLSGIAHPTATSAMAYVDMDTGDLRIQATVPARAHVTQTAMCLIQAGHALSPLIGGDPLRQALTDAEHTLGSEITAWKRT